MSRKKTISQQITTNCYIRIYQTTRSLNLEHIIHHNKIDCRHYQGDILSILWWIRPQPYKVKENNFINAEYVSYRKCFFVPKVCVVKSVWYPCNSDSKWQWRNGRIHLTFQNLLVFYGQSKILAHSLETSLIFRVAWVLKHGKQTAQNDIASWTAARLGPLPTLSKFILW